MEFEKLLSFLESDYDKFKEMILRATVYQLFPVDGDQDYDAYATVEKGLRSLALKGYKNAAVLYTALTGYGAEGFSTEFAVTCLINYDILDKYHDFIKNEFDAHDEIMMEQMYYAPVLWISEVAQKMSEEEKVVSKETE